MAASVTLDATDSRYDFLALSHLSTDIITIATGETVTLENAATIGVRVICKDDVNLTLSDVALNMASSVFYSALDFQGGTNTFKLLGTSKVSSGSGYAGIVAQGATQLTISGPGKITAEGKDSGAGIGGSGYNQVGGTIIIEGGQIIAKGGYNAAGIGGGSNGAGGTVIINGGIVTATGGSYGAGIGGGESGAGGIVTINGGTVTATGGDEAAGIGGGSMGDGGKVSISGNALVYASGGSTNQARDIGSGLFNSNSGTLSISGMSEVFLAHAIADSVDPDAPNHSIEPTSLLVSAPMIGVGKLYNFTSPAGWEADSNSGYFIYRTVSNPQTGQTTDSTWLFVSVILLLSLGGLAMLKR